MSRHRSTTAATSRCTSIRRSMTSRPPSSAWISASRRHQRTHRAQYHPGDRHHRACRRRHDRRHRRADAHGSERRARRRARRAGFGADGLSPAQHEPRGGEEGAGHADQADHHRFRQRLGPRPGESEERMRKLDREAGEGIPMNYLSYFGLREPPFGITPDTTSSLPAPRARKR